jgi:PAS domain S-box-containing protein
MDPALAIAPEQGEEEDFRTLVDLAPDAVFVTGPGRRVAYVNAAACELMRARRSGLLGQRLDALLPFPWPKAGDGDATLPAPVIPAALRRADGSSIPVQVSARVLAGGRVQAWVRDVSSRKDLEHSLGTNERMLQTIFDLLPVGIWMADASGRIVANNPAAKRIWNGARYVELGEYGEYQGWWVATGEPIAPQEWALARAVTKGETSSGELVRIQCFDGSFKTIINSGAPLRNEHGEITGAIVVNEDITLLHEAQEKRRASEDLLRTVFDLLPVGLWIVDREGRITLANPAAEHIWSGPQAVAGTQSVAYQAWWVESGEPIADQEWALARALRGETSHNELIRIRCFDGSTKTIINWAAPIRSATGDIMGAIGASEDVTSLQYTQEQLRSAVRDRERILAVVAHDLRNPLMALMAHAGVVDMVSRRLPGAEKLAAEAATIVDISKRMSGLVRDLLSVGAAGTGGHHMLDLGTVAPEMLMQRAAEAIRPLLAEKGLALETSPAAGLPMLRADADRILRVLGNLLDNALKFTEPPGRVTMAVKSISAGLLFTVANSGPAVPAAELDTMFQPFWQAQSNRAGTGLGLAICRSIVEAHGGTIWAEPAVGQRLRVCFVLPRT